MIRAIPVFIGCLLLSCYLINAKVDAATKLGLVTINNQNDHTIKLIQPETDPYDCTKVTDPKILKDRMALIPRAQLLENLMKLDTRTRMSYARLLSADEANRLLEDIKRFTAQEQKKLYKAEDIKLFIQKLEQKQRSQPDKIDTFLYGFIVAMKIARLFLPPLRMVPLK